MLNFLAFKPGKEAHESYQKYGQGFAKSAGAKRGGTAKIVGKVIDEGAKWDEIALAHYPSIQHFTEMLASEDYQEINHRYRLPALEDTWYAYPMLSVEVLANDTMAVYFAPLNWIRF